jgi:3'(2'), 5'-bisphosphate nucleotidase
MTYDREHDVAIEAVLKACILCQAVQSDHLSEGVIGKEDGSPVTVADFGAQAVVSAQLASAFPNDILVSEEDAHLLRQTQNTRLKDVVISYVRRISPRMNQKQVLEAIDRGAGSGGAEGRFWTLDPIDGTKGFLRGDQYAVALALIEQGHVVLGVLGCPNLPLDIHEPEGPRGCLFMAVRGKGSVTQGFDDTTGKKIKVATVSDPSQALFCESFEPSHSSHNESAQVAQVLGTRNPPLRMDSQCKYGVLARGDVSIYLRLPTRKSYLETIWDHAAGSIIVQEAGGKVTDLQGRPLDFSAGRRLVNNRGVVATNGRIHHEVLEAVQRVVLIPH